MPAQRAFHLMIKPGGARCNLACSYCFYREKTALYPGSSFKMSDETLEKFTREYLEAQNTPRVVFGWQGGEPALLGRPFYEKALAYQRKYAPPGIKIENTFQTNGTLLDDDWCAFFKDHEFLIGLSLDGPAAIHDAYRRDPAGAASYQQVFRGLQKLHQYAIEFNVLATVNAVSAQSPLPVYRFLRDEAGARHLQFIPIVERSRHLAQDRPAAVSHRSVEGKAYGAFLNAVFDEWWANDVGKIFVQIFDETLARTMGYPGGPCVSSPTCGLSLALEHSGDLYACDHFVEPEYRLGNIANASLAELAACASQVAFGQSKWGSLPQVCRECEVLFFCNGGCPKDRLQRSPQGEGGLNHLCAGYKGYFTHVEPAMRQMARGIRSAYG